MSSGQVLLEIQTNDSPNVIERRFPESTQIVDLKDRLEILTGASAGTMQLTFYDSTGGLIATAADSNCIADYVLPGAEQRLTLRVKDSNIVQYDDLSSVPKYEISEEEYAKRNDSVMAFKIRNKLGRFSDKVTAEAEQVPDHIKIGDRCQVTTKNVPPRRGQVMYIGKIGDKLGIFVGIRYDEPCGKNDGTFQDGVRYVFYLALLPSFILSKLDISD